MQRPSSKSRFTRSPPAWIIKGADLDFDFTTGRYWSRYSHVPPASLLTYVRANTAWADSESGIWQPFAANHLRQTDKGVKIEAARTNVVLWNRDLTNAAWTLGVTMTSAKDQIGIDGVANSASSITGGAVTATNTILQAITLASSARFQTAFVKRLVGSGTIEMTMDGGATWTAITVTAVYTRVSIPTQTLANPSVGFRITTSGDSIAVDFVQNENSGLCATSPIETTTASVARAAESLNLALPTLMDATQGTIFAEWLDPGPVGLDRQIYRLNANTGSTNLIFFRVDSDNKAHIIVFSAGGVTVDLKVTNVVAANTIYRGAFSYALDNFALATTAALETAILTDVGGAAPLAPTVSFGFGTDGGTSEPLFGNLRRIAWTPDRRPDSEINAWAKQL